MPCETSRHGLVARGGLGLPKVSLELALLYLFMPCRWPPLKRLTGLSGVAAHRVVSLRPSFTPLDTPRRTPMVVTVLRHMYAYGKTSMALPCRWPPFTRLISLVGMARCRASI